MGYHTRFVQRLSIEGTLLFYHQFIKDIRVMKLQSPIMAYSNILQMEGKLQEADSHFYPPMLIQVIK